MFSPWVDCGVQYVMKLVELKLWLAWVKYESFTLVPVYFYDSLPSIPPLLVWICSMIVQTSVENGDFLFSEMLSSSQSISVPFSLVYLNWLSCYIFKPFLYTIVLWHPMVRWRGSCPLQNCTVTIFLFKTLFSQNWLYTGLVIKLTLCCETTMVNPLEGYFKGTWKWSVTSMTLFLASWVY